MELTACLKAGEVMPKVEILVLQDDSICNGLLAHVEDRPYTGTATFLIDWTPESAPENDRWGDNASRKIITFRGTTRAECIALCSAYDEAHYTWYLQSHYIDFEDESGIVHGMV